MLGHFKPGERLPTERDLSEQFQVSRAATREALRVLENAGFIITRQGATGGAFVTALSFERIADAFLDLFMAEKISIGEISQVRILVEPEVARLAAQRVTPEYAERLNLAIDSMEFHFILGEMSGNRFLEGLVRSTIDLTGMIVDAVNVAYSHPKEEHRPIAEAVGAGDAEAAAAAMKKHAIANGESLMKTERLFREKNRRPEL